MENTFADCWFLHTDGPRPHNSRRKLSRLALKPLNSRRFSPLESILLYGIVVSPTLPHRIPCGRGLETQERDSQLTHSRPGETERKRWGIGGRGNRVHMMIRLLNFVLFVITTLLVYSMYVIILHSIAPRLFLLLLRVCVCVC